MVTIEWCKEQIANVQAEQERLIANINAMNGSIETYAAIIKKLEAEEGE